jgi:DNA ligase-1
MMQGQGTAVMDNRSLHLLRVLRDKEVTGNAALSLVADEIKRLTTWSAEVFKMILFKDLGCGVGPKTVIEICPDLFPHEFCMKAEDYRPDVVTFPCFGSPKIDGIRGVIREKQFYSSSGRPLYGLKHILSEFHRRDHLQDFHVWDGELVIPGLDFDTMSGLIRSNKQVPSARFRLFDAPYIPCDHLRVRYKKLKEACSNMLFTTIVPIIMLESKEDVDKYFEYCMKKGYEGAMIKSANCPYVYRKSWDWLKLKRSDTVDRRVVGIEEGTGKNINRVGSLLLEDGGKCGIGLSDKQRWEWFINPTKIVGHYVELDFMEASSKNKRRHPRLKKVLKRVRYDK